MKTFLLIFPVLTFILINFAGCDDGFIAFWAPERITPGKPLSTTIYSSKFQDEVKVGIQFRNSNSKFVLDDEEFKTIEISDTEYMASSGSLLNLTLHRTVTSSGNTNHQCSTKSIKILPEQRNFYIFIQTDKPVYKTEDEVKFRILVVDNDMKPFHMDTLKVDIVDPFGRIIQTFTNIEDQYLGLFEESFQLSLNTPLGDWDIQAVVDSKEQYKTAKIFTVQKLKLPLFEVHIETNEKHYLLEDDVNFVFYAKYSFGGFVTGDAELAIRNKATGYVFFRNLYRNVAVVETVTKNIKNHFEIYTPDVVALEAIMTFSEPGAGQSFKKSTVFYAHNSNKFKIIPIHAAKFSFDSNFKTIFRIIQWNGEKIKNSNGIAEMKFSFTTLDFNYFGKFVFLPIVDGEVSYDIEVPEKAEVLHLEVKFKYNQTSESEYYRARIEPGNTKSGIKSLNVDHEPKDPKLNDKVTITINSDTNLNKVLSIFTNKLGNIKSEVINCNNNANCEFDITIDEKMMPSTTVTLYNVVDKSFIYYGSTIIGTEVFKEENLNLVLSKTNAQSKDKVLMSFTAPKKSKIYLLAYDKNLNFLKDGNDITKDDISSSLGHQHGKSHLLIDDFSSWTVCSKEELDRVGVLMLSGEVGGTNTIQSPEYHESELHNRLKVSDEPSVLRQDFSETWIFESIETGDKETAMKEFTVPDSITTWLISAFSLNEDKGLAMATQELPVINEFFIKMDLPYSIKFMEVLRIDILVFNFAEAKDLIKAEIKLENLNGNEFQFVEFKKTCTPSYNNYEASSQTTEPFPYSSAKKVTFFIRSNPVDTDFDDKVEKKIKIKVTATGYGTFGGTYEDQVLKELVVLPAGVSDFIITTQDYKLEGTATKPLINHVNFTEELKSVNVVVSGNYLVNTIVMSGRYEIFPSDSLEQMTSKLKGNVEYYRYLLARVDNPSSDYFSVYYQSILEQQTRHWSYDSSTGYRAYFLDAIASAMEIGTLPKQSSIIETELDFLKSKQNNDGYFDDFGDFPSTDSKYGSQAAIYFQTAFVLIPFLKFKGIVNKNYDDVIKKGFDYLKSSKETSQLNVGGYTAAAYAYALNNDEINANQLLYEAEKLTVDHGNNKRCLKVSLEDSECQLRHTTYASLAYIQLNDVFNALPLINWLLIDQRLNYFYFNTYGYALAVEPIARLANYFKTDQTKLTVMLRNGRDFVKIVNITQDNMESFQNFELPLTSQEIITLASGYGYCSITTIFERSISLPKADTMFTLTVSPNDKNDREKILKVCAEYTGTTSLLNVIYEVEMPSGYVFDQILDFGDQEGVVKLITEKRGGTMLYIYYNDFEQNHNYCIGINARKSFHVMNAKLSSVKVYDYNDKQNVAIEFYKFTGQLC